MFIDKILNAIFKRTIQAFYLSSIFFKFKKLHTLFSTLFVYYTNNTNKLFIEKISK